MLCTERYERIVASAALAVALPFWALDTFVRVLRCGATAHGRHNQGSEDGARGAGNLVQSANERADETGR